MSAPVLPAHGTPLTRVQRRVLALLAAGHTKAEVGAQLYMTDNTIRTHVMRLRSALGARNVAHAVAIAYRLGLLDVDVDDELPRLAWRMHEVCDALGISHRTARRLIDRGALRATSTPGGNVTWIAAADVERLLATRRQPAARIRHQERSHVA